MPQLGQERPQRLESRIVHPLIAQNAFLLALAHVEKSQLDDRFVCTRIDFTDSSAALSTANGTVAMPLGANPAVLVALLEPALGALEAPSEEQARAYPSSGTLASRWAELHYDLGISDFLVHLTTATHASFSTLELRDQTAVVTLERPAGALTVEIDISEYPVHAATEIGEALDNASQR